MNRFTALLPLLLIGGCPAPVDDPAPLEPAPTLPGPAVVPAPARSLEGGWEVVVTEGAFIGGFCFTVRGNVVVEFYDGCRGFNQIVAASPPIVRRDPRGFYWFATFWNGIGDVNFYFDVAPGNRAATAQVDTPVAVFIGSATKILP